MKYMPLSVAEEYIIDVARRSTSGRVGESPVPVDESPVASHRPAKTALRGARRRWRRWAEPRRRFRRRRRPRVSRTRTAG